MRVQDRCRYVPAGYELAARDEALGIEVYADRVRNCAIGYAGRRNKPDFNYRFRDAARMDEYIAEFVVDVIARAKIKENRRAERQAAVRNAVVNVGDIFRASWGYDQTNIDYYEVVAVRGQMIDVREIGQQREGNGYMDQGVCVPVPGAFRGDVMRKRIQCYGDNPCFRIASYANAYRIDPVAVIDGVKIFAEDNWTAYA